jgi:hypothetical protein
VVESDPVIGALFSVLSVKSREVVYGFSFEFGWSEGLFGFVGGFGVGG